MDWKLIAAEVKKVTEACPGHEFEHVERVCKMAEKICLEEQADKNIVMLAALLHDCDDYKFFGADTAAKLTNARKIMEIGGCDEITQEKVCDIIRHIGFSNAKKGIRPQSKEGQIVSDADMLDAIGAVAITRTTLFSAFCGRPFFIRNVFPNEQLTAQDYQNKNRKDAHSINHFFEKLLKLKYLLFTDSAKREGEERHQFMVDFLRQFFKENQAEEWLEYLSEFLNRMDSVYTGGDNI